MGDKLKRINDLIEELQSEISRLIDAQSALGDVKQSTQRTDFRYSRTGFNHVKPE